MVLPPLRIDLEELNSIGDLCDAPLDVDVEKRNKIFPKGHWGLQPPKRQR